MIRIKSRHAKKHMARVAELPCVVCGVTGVQVHHIRSADFCGLGLRASDWFTFPLCHIHHAELHADKRHWEMVYGNQADHVDATLDQLYG